MTCQTNVARLAIGLTSDVGWGRTLRSGHMRLCKCSPSGYPPAQMESPCPRRCLHCRRERHLVPLKRPLLWRAPSWKRRRGRDEEWQWRSAVAVAWAVVATGRSNKISFRSHSMRCYLKRWRSCAPSRTGKVKQHRLASTQGCMRGKCG